MSVISTELATNAFGDQYMPAIDGALFANAPAADIFSRSLDTDFFRQDCLHIVIGSDSGLLINFIQQQGVPLGSAYLFIEPEAVHQTIAAMHNGLNNEQHIALCLPHDWVVRAEPMGLETYILKGQVLIHPSIASKHSAQSLYQPLLDQVFNELDAKAYAVKSCLVDGDLIKKTLDNISENILPVNTLFEQFNNQTAIILGAGPSLDLHLDWIKANREQLVIIAASRLCKRLIQEKLTPDIVVSIDSQEINYELSKALFQLPAETLLVHSNHVSPQLIAQWHGNSRFIGELIPWPSRLNTDNMQSEGGPTVANTALVLAGKLRFSTILLSGVDLCSPAGYDSHSGGDDPREHQKRTLRVMTNDGSTAQTNVQMLHAAKVMCEQTKAITTARIINLSSFACKVEGVIHQPPESIALAENKSPAWRETLAPITKEVRVEHNTRMLESMNEARQDLKKIEKLVNDAKGFNKKIYKKDRQGNYNLKARDKLDNIQLRLDQEFSHLAVPIKKLGMAFFINAMTTRDVNQFNDRQLEQHGFLYYDAYAKSAASLAQHIDSSIERIQSRLAEENSSPDFDQLIRQWRKDRQQGRAKVWQHHHKDTVSESDLAIVATMEAEYRAQHQPTTLIGPKPDQAWYIRQYVELAFKNADAIKLEKALQRFDAALIKPERIQQLQHLIQCYIELLRDSGDSALAHFPHINKSDYSEPLLLATLAAALSQQQISIIEAAYKALSAIDPGYQPQYANWLKRNNQVIEAADTYTGYLQQYPADIPAWLALAELYLEANEADMAAAVYNYVLEQEPENPTAIAFMNT